MNSFFARHAQREIPIREYTGKSPLFYPRMQIIGAVFTANLRAIRALLPDPRLEPLRVSPTRGLVGVHCMEYQESDIGPYNEVAVTLGVRFGSTRMPTPVRALKSVVTNAFEGFVAQLPVTTEVALYGGIDYFGYPKYLADISFRETRTHRICTLRDCDTKDLILELDGWRVPPTWLPRKLTLHTYPRKDGDLLHAQLVVRPRRYGMTFLMKHATVRLGNHPRATQLAELELGRPIQYTYAPRCEGILFMPERA